MRQPEKALESVERVDAPTTGANAGECRADLIRARCDRRGDAILRGIVLRAKQSACCWQATKCPCHHLCGIRREGSMLLQCIGILGVELTSNFDGSVDSETNPTAAAAANIPCTL